MSFHKTINEDDEFKIVAPGGEGDNIFEKYSMNSRFLRSLNPFFGISSIPN